MTESFRFEPQYESHMSIYRKLRVTSLALINEESRNGITISFPVLEEYMPILKIEVLTH